VARRSDAQATTPRCVTVHAEVNSPGGQGMSRKPARCPAHPRGYRFVVTGGGSR
jgi:hypothetical protein